MLLFNKIKITIQIKRTTLKVLGLFFLFLTYNSNALVERFLQTESNDIIATIEKFLQKKSDDATVATKGLLQNVLESKVLKNCLEYLDDQVSSTLNKYPELCNIRQTIDLYETNYFLYRPQRSTDNGAFEAQYSLRYNLSKITCMMSKNKVLPSKPDKDCLDKATAELDKGWAKEMLHFTEIFVSLTGKYDFYFLNDDKQTINRKSEKVVNRFFNPALHFQRIFPKNSNIDWIDIAIEHLSNGQSRDAEKHLFVVGDNNYEASDSNNISMNFLSISGQILKDIDNINFKFFGKAVLKYWNNDGLSTTIYKNGSKVNNFEDYHRLKVGMILETKGEEKWLSELSFTGYDFLSFDALVSIPVLSFLNADGLVLRYHNGHLSRLSNYALKEKTISVGIGVAF